MTQEEFLAFYPQFDGVFPDAVVTDTVARANARFSGFGPDAEEARRLFTAHRLTLYANAMLPEGAAATAALLSSAGQNRGSRQIASKKVGDVQISYAASGSASASSTALADLTETAFGLQLLTLIRLHAFPVYLP